MSSLLPNNAINSYNSNSNNNNNNNNNDKTDIELKGNTDLYERIERLENMLLRNVNNLELNNMETGEETLMGTLKAYFNNPQRINRPTVGVYRKLSVVVFIALLICIPLVIILKNDRRIYECTNDEIVYSSSLSTLERGRATQVFTKMSYVRLFQVWFDATHEEKYRFKFTQQIPSLISSNSTEIDFIITFEQSLSLDDNHKDLAADYSGPLNFYQESLRNRNIVLQGCVLVGLLYGQVAAYLQEVCESSLNSTYIINSDNHQAYDHIISLNNLSYAINQTSPQDLKKEFPLFYLPIGKHINIARICSLSSLYRSVMLLSEVGCMDLYGIEDESKIVADSISLRCSEHFLYDGLLWFAIFCIKLFFSVLVSGAIISPFLCCSRCTNTSQNKNAKNRTRRVTILI